MSGDGGSRYRTRLASGAEDLRRAQALRFRCFRGGGEDLLDQDAFDERAAHVLVEEAATGRLVCCLRLLRLKDGSEVGASYSAQFYGLDGLERYPGPMLEVGRFCVDPETKDPAVLRLAWRALDSQVAARGIGLLFGCSSFPGLEPGVHAEAFALLKERHLGPSRWRPSIKAPLVHRFGDRPGPGPIDGKAGARGMPPLLRSYLAMGGWVSDHAVVDRDLGRLHVFTALQVHAVPPARVRALRGRSRLDENAGRTA